MERKKNVKNFSVRLIVCIMLGIWSQTIFSSEVRSEESSLEEFTLDGRWSNIERSLIPTIPIKAYTDGYSVTIKNQSPNCDITIRILSEIGTVVFQEEVPAAETAYMLIPVDSLPHGTYILELTNTYGDFLQGIFNL
ncbi:MAG: DUF3244 domain-containing protein [Bacteroides sp.]|nr:DUF3244 domain-containing protein [Bacteroides sp.]